MPDSTPESEDQKFTRYFFPVVGAIFAGAGLTGVLHSLAKGSSEKELVIYSLAFLLGIFFLVFAYIWPRIQTRLWPTFSWIETYRKYGKRRPVTSLIVVVAIGGSVGALVAGGGWLLLSKLE